MAIRELSSQEVQNVSGGTFGLLSGLLSFKLNLLGSLFGSKSNCYTPAPAPTPCQPAPTPSPCQTCQPAPKPSYGC